MNSVRVLVEQKLPNPFQNVPPSYVAKIMGMSHSYMSRVNNGKVRVSEDQYNRIKEVVRKVKGT